MSKIPGADAIDRSTRAAYDLLWIAEHLLGERRGALVQPARQAVQRAIQAQLERRGPGRLSPIDRRDDLSRDEFMSRYVAGRTPVVLSGRALGWPCAERWTPEYFEERFGDDEITLINVSTDEITQDQYTRTSSTATLGEVIRGMRAGDRRYSRFAPLLDSHPELRDDLDLAWLESWRQADGVGRFFQLFIGGNGTNTGLHCAPGSNLFTQVYGTKRWYIYPTSYTPALAPEVARTPFFYTLLDVERPNLDRYPLAPYASGWEVVLQPGDILYVPPFFWHQVHNLSDSIAVGFRWYALGELLTEHLTKMLITLTASNPPVWVVRQNKANFNKVFAAGR